LWLKVLGMPKRSRSKKAVSPVIANVLMVMAVFALGTILFAWATSSFGSYQGGAGVWFVNRGEALKERFVVEYVSFGKSGPPWYNQDNITLLVRNVGSIDITVKAVYVNSTAYSFDERIGVDEVQDLQITIPNPNDYWDYGCVTRIAVVSERGNVIEGYWKAPVS